MKKIAIGFSVIILVLVLIFTFRKNHTISYEEALETYATSNSKFIDWQGIKLHYLDIGEGPTVMLIHGYAGSHTNWDQLMAVFPDGYRLIVPDLPGLGLSQFPEISDTTDLVELFADFSTTLIKKLDLDSIHLVGNSLGGFLAWETTLRNPNEVKSLTLLNAAGYSLDDVGAFFIKFSSTKLYKQIIKKGIPKFVAVKAAKGTLGDPSQLKKDRVDKFHGLLNKEGNLQVIGTLGTSGQGPDSTRIPNINVPTLIVWGDKDRIVPYQHAYKFDRDIPNSKLIIYEGSGHVPMIENPDRLMADLLEFWSSIEVEATMDTL